MRKILLLALCLGLLCGCGRKTVVPEVEPMQIPPTAVEVTGPGEDREAAPVMTQPPQEAVDVAGEVDALAREVTAAYFAQDRDTLRAHLTQSDSTEKLVSVYDRACDVEILRISTSQSVTFDLADKGYSVISAECRVPGMDSYCYLTMELVWENETFKLRSYGLEG